MKKIIRSAKTSYDDDFDFQEELDKLDFMVPQAINEFFDENTEEIERRAYENFLHYDYDADWDGDSPEEAFEAVKNDYIAYVEKDLEDKIYNHDILDRIEKYLPGFYLNEFTADEYIGHLKRSLERYLDKGWL